MVDYSQDFSGWAGLGRVPPEVAYVDTAWPYFASVRGKPEVVADAPAGLTHSLRLPPAAKSGSSKTLIRVECEAATTFSFWFNKQDVASGDDLWFIVDGDFIDGWDNTQDPWTQVGPYDITQGTHELSWEYARPFTDAAGLPRITGLELGDAYARFSAPYVEALQALLDGSIDWDADDVRAMLLTTGYAPDLRNHEFLDDVPAPARLATVSLAGRTIADGVFDASDVTFAAVSGVGVAVLLYAHTGVDASSRLLAYNSDVKGLPRDGGGNDVEVAWSDGDAKILRLL